jgi:hypothetical protein
MDMKKILQAMDGVSTKPVEGSNDMKKFLSVMTEGSTPHKVALPVQMAMQHYQKETKPVVKKESVIGKYFEQVEEAALQKQAHRKQLIQQYAHKVSQRVLEGRYGNYDAYQRDYDSSISGFGRQRREIDDEANLMYIYRDGRLKQRMISNHEERSAHAEGFRDSQEKALKIHGIIRSKFDPKKWVQKQGTQWIQVFPFGKPDEINKEQ